MTTTTLNYTADATGKVQHYIRRHCELRQSGAYDDPNQTRQLDAAGLVALHAILRANPQTGFSNMIEACNAQQRECLEQPA